MKSLAKVFACACVLALSIALAGCSSGGSASSASASAASEQSASVSASAEQVSAESSSSASVAASATTELAKGTYSAAFNTDSSMFHVNEANEGRGVLTVADDGMTIHVSLVSKKIVNLYLGTADQAQADKAGVIEPTIDKVTYSDGAEEEVYGFDIPVPALDTEFDVAILGEKGAWYDHKVSVSDPIAE